mgnify:CR=1 FL=1
MNKKIMNQIVKKASEHQNEKLKLNAGQWREAINIIFSTLYDLDLTVLKIREENLMKKTASKKVAKKVTKTSKKK